MDIKVPLNIEHVREISAHDPAIANFLELHDGGNISMEEALIGMVSYLHALNVILNSENRKALQEKKIITQDNAPARLIGFTKKDKF